MNAQSIGVDALYGVLYLQLPHECVAPSSALMSLNCQIEMPDTRRMLIAALTSFATSMWHEGEQKIVLPQNVLERWLTRFKDKCGKHGLDWLKAGDG